MTTADGYNLLEPVFASAARHPNRLALTTTRESATYGQLREFIISFAHHMRMHGLNQRTRIAIADGHPMINTILAMACALVGCSWVRAFPHALANPALRLTHCLHAGPPPPGLRIQSIAVPASWARPPRAVTGTTLPAFEYYQDARATWMIAQSSGTTGTPKYMALEAGSIWRRGLGNFCSVPAEIPVFTSMFPALSTLNIVPALHTFSLGGTFAFGHLPDIQGRIQIDAVLGSPSHFVDYMHEWRPGAQKLGTAIVTGSAAGAAFFTRMASYFETVTFAYGSTETSAVTATQIPAVPVTARDGAIDVGPAFPGVDIQIVGDDGKPVPQGSEGRVRIRAPCQAPGYIGEPALSEEVFAGGWFHPGDLGYLDDQGHLHISGRVNDRLNIGGRKLDPATVDALLQGLPDIRDGVCFALPTPTGIDTLAAAVVTTQPRDPAGIAQDLAKAATALPPGQAPDLLFVVPAIPRNPNGKALRHAMPEAIRGLAPTLVPSPFGDGR